MNLSFSSQQIVFFDCSKARRVNFPPLTFSFLPVCLLFPILTRIYYAEISSGLLGKPQFLSL